MRCEPIAPLSATPSECPRCAHETSGKLCTSPVPGVWVVLQCGRCLYTWRTTEPARSSRRDAYLDSFELTEADIDNAMKYRPSRHWSAAAVGAAAAGRRRDPASMTSTEPTASDPPDIPAPGCPTHRRIFLTRSVHQWPFRFHRRVGQG
ncbi:non-oxidative hydroxyarylic acid decarboxylases subunit D [Nocardia sp. NBC_00416]|uniref:non-oxidative hydroxyarylic acid decarboxylases subunit D n=1 Tax=Nocardia sp. NBC_00416 TaxID=2975991 RepID=UPI003FA59512